MGPAIVSRLQILLSIRPELDIVSPEFKRNPFPILAHLRTAQPVYRTILPDKTIVWLLTRYEDVSSLLKDERFAKNRYSAKTPEQLGKQPWVPPMFRPLERNMLDVDPPDHGRLRQLVQKVFTPRLVEQMRTRVETIANELLDKVEPRRAMDLVRDYALPLPMTIITEILGIPSQDRDKFHKWSNVIVSVSQFNNNWRVIPAVWRFNRYLRNYFKMRRAKPTDDLVSALLQAEEEGDKLSEDELFAMVFLLLVAGHETTVNLVATGMLALLENSDQLEKLICAPTLIGSAVEELLRSLSSPEPRGISSG